MDDETRAEGARTRRLWTAGTRGRLRIGVAVVGLLAATLLLTVGAVALTRSGEALPGVTVEGVDVGGLDEGGVRAVVAELAEERQQAQVAVTADDREFVFSPGAAGYSVDVDATVQAALDAGRNSRLSSLVSHVAATFGETLAVDLQDGRDDRVVEAFVDDVATVVDREPTVGAVTVDPETLAVVSEPPRDGITLDRDAAVAVLLPRVGDPDPDPVAFDVSTIPPPTDDQDVADAAERAATAVAEPLELTANDGTAVIEPAGIARMLGTTEQDGDLVLTVDPDALAEAIGPDLPDLEIEPVDATFEVLSDIPTFDDQGDVTWSPQPADLEVVPSTPGERFDPQSGADQVAALLEAGRHSGPLELAPAEADLTTEEAEQLGITHLIGTFTTYHSCCQNRVHNIQRLADLARGRVLRPGEDFSVNRDIGRRTRAKGFVADGAIFNGEIRDEVGGGVSQFATTSFNAAFFAGIPILDHRAHSLYISRYPRGREATLNYPSIDLKFANDTEHGLYIHTSYTGTSITVSLFGDNGGREVTAVMGEPFNYRGWEVRRKPNPGLPQGVEQVSQSGTSGYDVVVDRIIREDGEERTEEFFTRYYPRPQIVQVGTGPPPEPPPSPEPSEPAEGQPSEPADEPESSDEPTPAASGDG